MDKVSRKIAEAVSDAWHGHHGSGRMEIPVGVVAGLALVGRYNPGNREIAHVWAGMDNDQFRVNLSQVWALAWLLEPYLITVAQPIHSWLQEDLPEQALISARATARAALSKGLLDLVSYDDPYSRSGEDVLGHVVTELRSKGARKGLGEYHTPSPLATAMADVVISSIAVPMTLDPLLKELEPGQAIADPCAGTGGLLRAAAQCLRTHDRDPAQFGWFMQDIDFVAASCCAVNSILWGLSSNVLIWRGDTLTEPDGSQRAAEHKSGVLRHYQGLVGSAAMLATISRVEDLISGAVTPDESEAA